MSGEQSRQSALGEGIPNDILSGFQDLDSFVRYLAERMQDKIHGDRSEQAPDIDYFLFETFYRGDRKTIQKTMGFYLSFLEGKTPIIDFGCGRGEFLELLIERGWDAYGVDLSYDMVLQCRDLGLDVRFEDALEHLAGVEVESLGGVFSSQFIEHLSPSQLVEFLQLSLRRLKPGGVFIAETPNPQCLSVFANTFYLDMTHEKPVHPKTVSFLMEAAGFESVRIEFRSPYPEQHKLRRLPEKETFSPDLKELIKILNYNIDAMNYVVFGPQDYAVIGEKPMNTSEEEHLSDQADEPEIEFLFDQ